MSTETFVSTLPRCDFCKQQGKPDLARFDGRTAQGYWANMCNMHYGTYGTGLGTGKGQHLVLGDRPDQRVAFNAALKEGDMDAMMEAVGDGDLADFL